MGMQIFTASGTFDAAKVGLAVGDMVNVICVGGGGSGGAYYDPSGYTGNTGGVSSFGTLVAAAGGTGGAPGRSSGETYNGVPQAGAMAVGGDALIVSSSSGNSPGGGAGGYLPGCPVIGGRGGRYDKPSLGGLAGAAGKWPSSSATFAAISQDANSIAGSPGNMGAGAGFNYPSSSSGYDRSDYGAGGNGYGAGGGGGLNSPGGNAGSYAVKAVALPSLSVAVTVGAGGAVNTYGGGVGAPGVVVVFW